MRRAYITATRPTAIAPSQKMPYRYQMSRAWRTVEAGRERSTRYIRLAAGKGAIIPIHLNNRSDPVNRGCASPLTAPGEAGSGAPLKLENEARSRSRAPRKRSRRGGESGE